MTIFEPWEKENTSVSIAGIQHKLSLSSHIDHQVSEEPTNAREQPVIKNRYLSLCDSTPSLGEKLI